MQTDAFAGVFAETVAEDEKDDHHCEGESLREDFCTEEDGVINAVGQNRSTEDPEVIDEWSCRVEADKRIVVAHENAEEHMARNREEGAGDAS